MKDLINLGLSILKTIAFTFIWLLVYYAFQKLIYNHQPDDQEYAIILSMGAVWLHFSNKGKL